MLAVDATVDVKVAELGVYALETLASVTRLLYVRVGFGWRQGDMTIG